MPISILILTLAFLIPDPQTPNFYPGLMSAREASKKAQKEMIIFFSDKTCSDCEAAWMAFSKDGKATSQYVSTRMSRNDFDGGIFFDMLRLDAVPSWVILNPDGTEKERWEGGWKDANGNPSLFDMSVPKTEVKDVPKTENKPVTSASAKSTTPPAVSKSNPPATPKSSPTPSALTAVSSTHFIQAGYFGSEANAEKLVGDLKSKGHIGFEIRIEEKDGKTFYRVLKNFPNESSAKVEQQKFESAGIATSIKSRS